MRGQDHYDTWYDSGVSGRAVRSFYDPPQPKACRDCHLPAYPSQEFGNRGGFVHDHVFPAANNALPAIRGDAATQKQIQDFLKNKVLTVDLFAIKRGDQTLIVDDTPPEVFPGETLDVEVVVRTRGVGHPYTNGTADSNETWVSLEAESAGGKFFRSGVLDEAGRLDAGADRLWTLVIDPEGRHMDRRQPQDIRVPLYNNGIGPGAARVVHYRLTVPKNAAGAITLTAGTHYRKFSRDYTTFALGASHPSLPITTLASDTVKLPVTRSPDAGLESQVRGNPDPLWLRWNDYGIGLFLQGDLKGAVQAWTRVEELAPDKPDGPLNRARAEIAEGRLADAKASLAEAERRRPGWGKTKFFRATVAKDEGRLEDAARDLRDVLEKFPVDRVAWNNLGLVYWLGQDFPKAIEAFSRTLEIDPEDLNAHYNLMRIYRAMGNRGKADAEDALYRKYKDDETIRAIAGDFRIQNPYANRESLPIHVHAESSPPPAVAAEWVAQMGAKGYESDGGYLTRAHPPVPPEHLQWSYISKQASEASATTRVSSAP
jgi:tetratricopeptide (TPR) repeat protein